MASASATSGRCGRSGWAEGHTIADSGSRGVCPELADLGPICRLREEPRIWTGYGVLAHKLVKIGALTN